MYTVDEDKVEIVLKELTFPSCLYKIHFIEDIYVVYNCINLQTIKK